MLAAIPFSERIVRVKPRPLTGTTSDTGDESISQPTESGMLAVTGTANNATRQAANAITLWAGPWTTKVSLNVKNRKTGDKDQWSPGERGRPGPRETKRDKDHPTKRASTKAARYCQKRGASRLLIAAVYPEVICSDPREVAP